MSMGHQNNSSTFNNDNIYQTQYYQGATGLN